jgi:peptidoglycan hydrolase CwlO-like protein
MPQKLTPEIIIAAIAGFEAQKNHIDSQIAELRSILDGGSKEPFTTTEFAKPRKKRSAAVRRKMALAQRARFAKLKQSSEPSQAESAKPKKRKLSAAGRKNIIEATKRRWAAIRAAKEAGKPAVAKTAGRKKGAP